MSAQTTGLFLSQIQERSAQQLLNRLNSSPASADRLHKATKYALLNGGKRLRPALTYAACLACGGTLKQADDAACALEMIHCYSLVHDDLPAMDDDALRRGKPTCHIAYDEGTAILVGDTLQTKAFQVLLQAELAPALQLQLITLLVDASGFNGMADGQALDLAAEKQAVNLEELTLIHQLKTGKLITCALEMGGHCAGANTQDISALAAFGAHIGLAFQIQDDILDVTASTEALGKQQGADQVKNKSTFPSLLGLQGAQKHLLETSHKAKAALESFSGDKMQLLELADFIIERKS